MPTRRDRANMLLQMLEKGPALTTLQKTLTPEEAVAGMKRWLDTWITPEVKRLVPELQQRRRGPDERNGR